MYCWASVSLALRLSDFMAVDILTFEGGGGVRERGGGVALRAESLLLDLPLALPLPPRPLQPALRIMNDE